MNSQVPDTVSQTGEDEKQSGLITCVNRQTVKSAGYFADNDCYSKLRKEQQKTLQFDIMVVEKHH